MVAYTWVLPVVSINWLVVMEVGVENIVASVEGTLALVDGTLALAEGTLASVGDILVLVVNILVSDGKKVGVRNSVLVVRILVWVVGVGTVLVVHILVVEETVGDRTMALVDRKRVLGVVMEGRILVSEEVMEDHTRAVEEEVEDGEVNKKN